MPRYGRSAADAAYEDDAKNFGKLPTPRSPESLLDRLERVWGIDDWPVARDGLPDLIAAARALKTMIVTVTGSDRDPHVYGCGICAAGPREGEPYEHRVWCPVPDALAAWEKVSRDG